jgi:hypothetical protein
MSKEIKGTSISAHSETIRTNETVAKTPFTAPVAGHWSSEEGTEMANRYLAMDRGELAYGQMSDLELANAVYMADRTSLDLIVMQRAAKERIRWLSAQLAYFQAASVKS